VSILKTGTLVRLLKIDSKSVLVETDKGDYLPFSPKTAKEFRVGQLFEEYMSEPDNGYLMGHVLAGQYEVLLPKLRLIT